MGASRERVIVVGTENDRRLVRVYVQDTGPGVPADVFDTLFDPYVRSTTATAEGLGLGLATVKRLVEAHGGEVGVSSRPGCTRFWFSLPRAADLEDPALTRPASARSAT
jgi:signal transduction histidine kinase